MEIPELDSAGLRKFGLTTGVIVAVLFGLLLPWLFNFAWPMWPWILAGVLVVWALIHPASLKGVYFVWMRFGYALGWINSRIILGILFYLVFLPIGFVIRLFGWDPMAKRLDKNLQTYRVASDRSSNKHMDKPY